MTDTRPRSPARAHLERTAAAQRDAEGPAAQHVNANAYELMLMKLAEDKRALKDIQSLQKKLEYKAKVLPDYAAWVDGALANEGGVQDDVLTTIMVWRIDVGDIPGALAIARYVIAHKLVMPDHYKRSAGCLIAEELADTSLKAIEALQPTTEQAAELAKLLLEADQITADADMPDEVRAKLKKATGYALRAAGDNEHAVATLREAFKLHDRVGVKKDIERLETLIKNSAPAPGDNPGDGS
jgi:hypothetical protein